MIHGFLPLEGKVDSERGSEDGWGEAPKQLIPRGLWRTATPTPTSLRSATPSLKGGEVGYGKRSAR